MSFLPGRIQETDTLKVVNVKKDLTNRIDDAFRFTLRSTGRYSEIRRHRCCQIAKETEGEEERETIRRNKRIAIIALRYGSELMDGGTIVRIVNLLLPTVS